MAAHSKSSAHATWAVGIVVLLLVGGGGARADTCCYGACRPISGSLQGSGMLMVVCVKGRAGCPQTTGSCGLFAEKTKGVECAKPSTCDGGEYGGNDADTLVVELAKDTDLAVVNKLQFRLRSGARVFFEP